VVTAVEPTFLESRRQRALALTTTLTLPAKTDEAWRRTSLDGLDVAAYKPVATRVELKGDVPAGVIFTDMLTAAATHPELVSRYLGTLLPMDQNLLTAANAAHLAGGAFLYVPKNVVIAEPLQVVYSAADGEAQYLHTVVVADENAAVTILERYEGTGEYLHVGVVEVFPLQGAKVHFGYLQNQSEDAWSFLFRRAITGRDASIDWAGGEFGGAVVRSELVTEVAGDGSESTIKVVFGAAGNQHIDLVASEVHTGLNGRSNILGRGVLTGKAHTVFRGYGGIRHGARNSSTYQRQQALILSEKARADSIPALIIDEHEVAGAGHASTVGKLDEEQLFYLMARGLGRREAINMLVMAFLTPILSEIPVEALRAEMTRLMGEKVIR
jgi:Fe-S cluster assembly protein SufD